GQVYPMTEEKRAEFLAANKAMADRALRVLAAAFRHWEFMPESLAPDFLEQDLCFIGMTGMIDPVRPEVKDAIALCRSAGIRPVMITGDHIDTAVAIAKELNIIDSAEQALTGTQLNAISDEVFDATIADYGVYARVQPEHKVRIVGAWKKAGCVTAMTGDGVNDAPAIKAADIGVGMGITGTDVTKNVADMVLADDNFATIVSAVDEGRRIYDNIRKAIQFLLASNISEVLGVFLATLFGFTLLKPVHLLFINLITDTFPALALGTEKAEPGLMQRPPRKSSDGIFSNGLGLDVLYQGVCVALIVLTSYILGHCLEVGFFEIPHGVSPDGMTMAFITMNMAEIFHSFNMRSQRHSVFTLGYQNKALWLSMLGSFIICFAVVMIPPVAGVFGFTAVSGTEFLLAVVLGFLIIPIVEIVKACQRAVMRARRG
ncbi:MAG: cation-translocating P-type ATPase, partial [Lachnospiraceae bacterium]|nr:cation-translocating P-type ATPase [Lachnospiraceae bacterium]